jgi:hypothetical protein
MNTQAKETNKNTRVTIKSINGVSFVKEKTETPNGGEEKKKGCGGSIAMTGVIALAVLALGGVALNKKSK